MTRRLIKHTILAGITAALLLAPLACLAVPADTTYYIDPIKGDDVNADTTGNKPWASFAKLNALALRPGDRVMIAPGVHDLTLQPSATGTKGKPVIIRFMQAQTYGIAAFQAGDTVEFVQCAQNGHPVIWINPHNGNSDPALPVHEQIRILDNDFDGGGISAKSVKGLTITGNRSPAKSLPVQHSACTDVVVE